MAPRSFHVDGISASLPFDVEQAEMRSEVHFSAISVVCDCSYIVLSHQLEVVHRLIADDLQFGSSYEPLHSHQSASLSSRRATLPRPYFPAVPPHHA